MNSGRAQALMDEAGFTAALCDLRRRLYVLLAIAVISSIWRSREENGDFKKPESQLRGATHMTKTRIALAAVLFATTGSAAFAQFGPGYPSYAEPDTCGCSTSGLFGSVPWAPAGTLYSAPVRLHARGARLRSYPVLQQREVALPMADVQTRGPYWYPWSGPTKGGM